MAMALALAFCCELTSIFAHSPSAYVQCTTGRTDVRSGDEGRSGLILNPGTDTSHAPDRRSYINWKVKNENSILYHACSYWCVVRGQRPHCHRAALTVVACF